jgi:SAM-dependent methyltransferase
MSEIASSQPDSGRAGARLCCPICESSEFQVFRGRENAFCSTCRTVERTRLLWMILEKKGLFRRGLRVMHIAPERPLAKRYFDLLGEHYYACDIDPSRYANRSAVVRPIDLCCDLVKLPSRIFDVIIHTHVLEHLRCQPESVLHELERILAPGGHHFMAVPMKGKETQEDLSDDLTPEQRDSMFGQADHYRIFGSQSVQEMLDRVWGAGEKHNIEPLELFGAGELERAAIPEKAWTGISGVTIFHHMRPQSARVTAKEKKPSEPKTEESVIRNIGPSAANGPVEFQTGAGNLILHIGMPSTGAASLQRWLAKNRETALGAGLDYWSIAQTHSRAMTLAFTDAQAAGLGPAGNLPEPGQAQPNGEAAKRSLDQFLAGLKGRTGFISAEQLWNFPSAQVKALAAYLHDRDVRPLVLCWVRQPAEQLSQVAQTQCKSSLAIGDLDVGFEKKTVLRYNRLNAWIENFGRDRVIAAPFGGNTVQQSRNLLQSLGIHFDSVDPVEHAPDPALSLTAAKALLALNQARKSSGFAGQWSPRLRNILQDIKGADFRLPESLLLSMTGEFEKDAKYLVNQFSMNREWLVSGGIGMDDALFFHWSWDEVVSLLTALNEALLQTGTRGSAASDDGTA